MEPGKEHRWRDNAVALKQPIREPSPAEETGHSSTRVDLSADDATPCQPMWAEFLLGTGDRWFMIFLSKVAPGPVIVFVSDE